MFSNPQKNLLQVAIAPGAVIADLGAGVGHYAIYAAEITGDNGEVYAIDINEDLLKRLISNAKENKVSNIHTICSNFEKPLGTALKDSSVDLVIIANTFFLVSDKKNTLEEIRRIMRPKGRLLFIEWQDSFAGVGPHRDHVFSKENAQKLFAENKFEIVREIEAGDHHYGLVLRKK